VNSFDYRIPDDLRPVVKPGFLVYVPFRRQETIGLVTELLEKTDIPKNRIRDIGSLAYDTAVYSQHDLEIINFAAEYYMVSPAAILKSVLPDIPKRSAVSKPSFPQKTIKRVKTAESLDPKITTPGLFIYDNRAKLLENIINFHKKNKGQVIILEPQIEYVKNTAAYLNQALPEMVAALYGNLSKNEYWNNWLKFVKGEKTVLVSTRPGIFTPAKNLAAIFVMDEELDDFKQYDQNPRYDSRTIAKKVSEQKKIPVVFGSPAPRLVTWHRVKTSNWPVYRDITNNDRLNIIDLEIERRFENFSLLSTRLEQASQAALQKGKKVLLFFNRRGWATSVLCGDCGYLNACPECQLPLVAHAEELICHHCGYSQSIPLTCPKCGNTNIKMIGAGIERLEQEIKKNFTGRKILRLDKDTGRDREYDLGNYEIIIGTNLLIKEYYWQLSEREDFGVIGIINADNLYNIPDYRSSERAWQEIRKIKNLSSFLKAELFIQTTRPGNKVITNINDPEKFFTDELKARKKFNYPPFTRLIKLIIQDPRRDDARKRTRLALDNLKKIISVENVDINGPYPSTPEKIRNQYRYIIILKIPLTQNYDFLKKLHNDIIIDVDPIYLLK
jgi:primosomal protein N' (replication factor Y)